MNKRIIAKEWIVLIAGFSFGILFFPSILTLLFDGTLKNILHFYEALFDNQNFLIPWLVVLIPYFLIQIIRATIWSVKQLKQK